jgi:hypothetical protein
MREGRLSPVRPISEWTQEQVMHYATMGRHMGTGSDAV